MDENVSQRRVIWIALLIVLALDLLVAGFITTQVIAYREYPFDSDEATHAVGGLELALALKNHDWGGFLSEFYRQAFYPPGISWVKGLVFLTFGATPFVARMFSVVCLFLAILVLYGLCLELDGRYGWLIGLIAVTLTLTVQSLLANAALVMVETPGLLVALLMLWVYVCALEHPTRGRLLLTSALLTFNFLVKYTYGVAAIGTFAVVELSLFIRGEIAGTERTEKCLRVRLLNVIKERWLWLFGAYLLAMGLWFCGPGKIAGFIAYANARPPNQTWISWENFIFYLRSIALHDGPSPLFALVTLAGIIWGVTRWRDPRIRLILCHFAIGTGMMTINLPKDPRFIVTFVPAAHILTGLLISWMVASWYTDLQRRQRVVLAVGGAAITLCAVLSIPIVAERFITYPSYMEVEYETDPEIGAMMDWVYVRIPPGKRFYIINFWEQASPQAISWYWGTHERLPAGTCFDELRMPHALLKPASPETIAALRQEISRSEVQYVVAFEGGLWGERAWPEYEAEFQDFLVLLGEEEFNIRYCDAAFWLERSLLTRQTWEQVKAEEYAKIHLHANVYRVIKL